MLDLVGWMVIVSVAGINLAALTQALPGTLARRLGIGGVAFAWVGLACGLGAAGELALSPTPVPLIGVLLALPLLAAALLALGSARVRAALLAIPMPLLIGLNSLRVMGVLFLVLAVSGRLSGPFPYVAGIGDIITGAVAVPLALGVARSRPSNAVGRWNVFGALDLIVAVALAVTSAAGSPVQLFHGAPGSEAIQFLPYCLVPAVLVPFYLITHALVAAQLAAARTATALSPA